MTTPARARGRGHGEDTVPEAADAAALAACAIQANKIRYACERNRPNPTTATVRDWLTRHGVSTRRSYVSTVVNTWRKEHGLADTGDLPTLSADLLAELDADQHRVQDGVQDAFTERLPPRSEREHPRSEHVVNAFASPVNAFTERQHPRSQCEHPRSEREHPRSEHVVNAFASPADQASDRDRPQGVSTWIFVLGAVVGLVVSVDTSWRFFGDKLGVSNLTERVAMFAGMEIVLIACGVAMFEGVRRQGGTPGPARWLAWALCGASAYAAVVLSGPFLGLARVLFGPVLSVVALHFALGVELRARGYQPTGTLARIGRELRERFLSRFGLANDDRDALTRTRDRAARRTARLALASKWTPLRQSRLHRAVRKSNVAHDPNARTRMLAELAAIRHATDLCTLPQPSPWTPTS
jgi:hypothetical protein